MNWLELKTKVQEKKNSDIVNRAKTHQDRLKFHTKIALSENKSQSKEFLTYVSKLIPKDKFQLFKNLLCYPLPTNKITEEIFRKISRVFDGQNPIFRYEFVDDTEREDWGLYRDNILRADSIWENKGFEYFKTEINSILVVDMKEQPNEDGYPEPYFYFLPISRVIAFECNNEDGVLDWLAFEQGDDIVVIDDSSYRVVKYSNGIVGDVILENHHDLGYTPCRFFWNEPLSLDEPNLKKSPLTKILDGLNWYLFFHTSKKHLDLYGAYPIYSAYQQDCDYNYTSNDDRIECNNGFLRTEKGEYIHNTDGTLRKCPKCSVSKLVGAGSFIEIPVPDEDNAVDLRNPVQMLSIDRNSLDYSVQEDERLYNNLISSVVGVSEAVQSKEAINEKQVRANFDSQSSVINRLKKGFEEAISFVDSTICKLRYGSSQILSVSISLGTEFYLLDENELRARYEKAKENGASESELEELSLKQRETEFRNNPNALQRMEVLSDLEPYRHLSRSEILDLNSRGIISNNELILKFNFSDFIKRFERENGSILEYEKQKEYKDKINSISNKLNEYVKERTITTQN